MRRGFTLIEVFVTVLICAGLAGIAFPAYNKTVQKHQANRAIAYLRAIAFAEKMYFAKNGEYACQTATDCDTALEIRSVLGPEIADGKFSFAVTATTTTFIATATGYEKAIILWQDGTWHGNYSPLPTN